MFKLFGVSSDTEVSEVEQVINIEGEMKDQIGQVAVDILETPYELIILAPIAGIELEDIDISFSKSILTIKGFRQKPEIYSDDIVVRNNECFWGKFVRNIILPENLDFDRIKASLENNLLVITIQKLHFSTQHIKIDRVEI